MKKIAITSVFAVLISASFISTIAQQVKNKDEQIAGALQAAPEDDRDQATVLGYDELGNLVTLKEGTNNLICIADNPNQAGFNSACYHKDLEPFMARGRDLKAKGKNQGEIFNIREEEAKKGLLQMPKTPTTLHVLSGSDGKYNPETKQIENVTLRYVVYIPWATSESTGLPIRPEVPGGPWIMDPGTHRAHIMISPPAEMQKQ